MDNHHFQDGICCTDPLGQDGFEEVLAYEGPIFLCDLESYDLNHFVDCFLVAFHDGVGHFDDGVHHELDEGSLEGFSGLAHVVVSPALSLLIEVIISP